MKRTADHGSRRPVAVCTWASRCRNTAWSTLTLRGERVADQGGADGQPLQPHGDVEKLTLAGARGAQRQRVGAQFRQADPVAAGQLVAERDDGGHRHHDGALHADIVLRAHRLGDGDVRDPLHHPARRLLARDDVEAERHVRVRAPEVGDRPGHEAAPETLALLPPAVPDPVREALAGVTVAGGTGDPVPDAGWGEPGLSAAERLYAWNTLEVLSLGAGDIDRPVNAIPGRARAVLQLRYIVGTEVGKIAEVVAGHLAEHGYPMVEVRVLGSFAASRTPLDDPWVRWAHATLERVAGRPVAVLPNIGGSLPDAVFTDVLGLPTLWLPHSHPGCLQHAPDEHLPAPPRPRGPRPDHDPVPHPRPPTDRPPPSHPRHGSTLNRKAAP